MSGMQRSDLQRGVALSALRIPHKEQVLRSPRADCRCYPALRHWVRAVLRLLRGYGERQQQQRHDQFSLDQARALSEGKVQFLREKKLRVCGKIMNSMGTGSRSQPTHPSP